jgi:hypothetical protein
MGKSKGKAKGKTRTKKPNQVVRETVAFELYLRELASARTYLGGSSDPAESFEKMTETERGGFLGEADKFLAKVWPTIAG